MEYMEYKAHIQIPAAWHSMHNKMRALLVSVTVTVHGWNRELPWIHQEDGLPGRTASRVPQTEEEMMRKKRQYLGNIYQWQLEKAAEIKKAYQWLEKTGRIDQRLSSWQHKDRFIKGGVYHSRRESSCVNVLLGKSKYKVGQRAGATMWRQ